MPAESKKQYQFMKAVAENKKFADKVGVPQTVGKEFTKVKKYNKGAKVDVTEDTKGLEKEIEKKIKKRGDKKIQPSEEYMKELRAKDPEKHLKMVKKYFTGMKAGGKIGMGMTKNNYKKGGKVSSCSKRADGCAKRGKTKGRMV